LLLLLLHPVVAALALLVCPLRSLLPLLFFLLFLLCLPLALLLLLLLRRRLPPPSLHLSRPLLPPRFPSLVLLSLGSCLRRLYPWLRFPEPLSLRWDRPARWLGDHSCPPGGPPFSHPDVSLRPPFFPPLILPPSSPSLLHSSSFLPLVPLSTRFTSTATVYAEANGLPPLPSFPYPPS